MELFKQPSRSGSPSIRLNSTSPTSGAAGPSS
jgi:hypothetical protein